MAALEWTSVSKRYGVRQALADVSFALPEGAASASSARTGPARRPRSGSPSASEPPGRGRGARLPALDPSDPASRIGRRLAAGAPGAAGARAGPRLPATARAPRRARGEPRSSARWRPCSRAPASPSARRDALRRASRRASRSASASRRPCSERRACCSSTSRRRASIRSACATRATGSRPRARAARACWSPRTCSPRSSAPATTSSSCTGPRSRRAGASTQVLAAGREPRGRLPALVGRGRAHDAAALRAASLALARESFARRRAAPHRARARRSLSLLSLLVVDSCTSCGSATFMRERRAGRRQPALRLDGHGPLRAASRSGRSLLSGALASDHLDQVLEDGSAPLVLARPVGARRLRAGAARRRARRRPRHGRRAPRRHRVLPARPLRASPSVPPRRRRAPPRSAPSPSASLAMTASLYLPRLATLVRVFARRRGGSPRERRGASAARRALAGVGGRDRFAPPLGTGWRSPCRSGRAARCPRRRRSSSRATRALGRFGRRSWSSPSAGSTSAAAAEARGGTPTRR